MAIRIGCIDFPIPPSRYFREWNLVEIQQTLVRFPGEGTIKRWLRESPEGFEFIVAVSPLVTIGPANAHFRYQPAPLKGVWRKYAPFGGSQEVADAFAESAALASELGATILLFQTAPDFGPTKQNMQAMRTFFESARRGKRRWVWEPRGGWDVRSATAFAKELRLALCVDPLSTPPPDPAFAYFHLPGPAGFRSRYEEEALVRLRDICHECAEVYCLFGNIDMHNDATRFHQLVQLDQRR